MPKVIQIKLYFLYAVLLVAALISPITCLSTNSAEDNIVIKWDEATLEAVRRSRFPPPQTARALAIVHTCIYDAWAAYDSTAIGTQLNDSLRRPQEEHTEQNKEKAISVAAYRALEDLFPNRINVFNDLMEELGFDPTNNSTDITTPEGIGNTVTAAVLDFRHSDGSNQLGDLAEGAYADYTNYKPINPPNELIDLNRWQPLFITPDLAWRKFQASEEDDELLVQAFLTPHWQNVVPFALESSDQFRPPPPPLHPNKTYTKRSKELIKISAMLNDRRKVIAEYWVDGPNSETPPGHWCFLAQSVARRDNQSIDDSVKMFFALANAMLDASIACWESKRFYDYVRPVTSIGFLFKNKRIRAWGGPNQGTRKIKGSAWRSYIPTPSFAEYVSGHSTFSAAAAEILKLFTENDFFGESHTQPARSLRIDTNRPKKKVILRWKTFTQAANEAGISRRYGGIHFKEGDLEGRILGRKVAIIVWEKANQFFNEANN